MARIAHTQGKQYDVNLPMVIIRCKGHQKGNTVQEIGNKMMGQVAEQAVEEGFSSRR